MEGSLCTSGFGAIIWRDLRTVSLPCVLLCDNLNTSTIQVHARKGNSRLTKLLGRLKGKIQRCNNSTPYMMARWPPQQTPSLNFLGFSSLVSNGLKENQVIFVVSVTKFLIILPLKCYCIICDLHVNAKNQPVAYAAQKNQSYKVCIKFTKFNSLLCIKRMII